jgi:hypothetical protein
MTSCGAWIFSVFENPRVTNDQNEPLPEFSLIPGCIYKAVNIAAGLTIQAVIINAHCRIKYGDGRFCF